MMTQINDSFYRPGFRTGSHTVSKKVDTKKLVLSKGYDIDDLANVRPGFKRSNPQTYIPDFVGVEEQRIKK